MGVGGGRGGHHESSFPCKCSQAAGHHLTEALGVGAVIAAMVGSTGRLGQPLRSAGWCQALPLLSWEYAKTATPAPPISGDNSQLTLRRETADIQTKSSPLIPERMAEQTNLSSPTLTKTPKAQQTTEQPLAKETGNYQKRYFTFKDIEEA